jgi:parallel beta-helix repeat protein
MNDSSNKEGGLVNSKFGKAIVSGLALVFAICVAASANATVFVGGCGAPNFATIQAGVNAAPAGSIVDVCPGSYPEQVFINKRLTVQGIAVGTANQAVVTAPAGGIVANTASLSSGYPIAAQIWVHDTTAVNIYNLVVDGSGNNGLTACGVPNLIGIYYQDASGIVNHDVVRNQTSVPANGCGQGVGLGIYVQSGISNSTHKAGTSTVSVLNNSVHDFQKNGITGNEVGTKLTASLNQVRGQGPTNGAAENGIQLGFGATGTVNVNTVIDEIWAPDTSSDTGDAAAGILVYDAANVNISSNRVGNAQFGIGVVGDGSFPADNATISTNTLDGTLIFDGIDVCGSSGGTISGNTIGGSTQSGIHLDGTCTPASGGTTVGTNAINEGCAGILNGTAGNTIAATNTYFNTVNTTLVGDVCPVLALAATSASSLQDITHQDVLRPAPARP